MAEQHEQQHNEAVRKRLQEDKEAADRSRQEGNERLSKGKPTPTQEENDRAKLGERIREHEDDGSGPDPYMEGNTTRVMREGKPSGPGYQTRRVTPASHGHSSGGSTS